MANIVAVKGLIGLETRFVIVNRETGEILDDAQGWGYKTEGRAHAAWAYKSKNEERVKKPEGLEEIT